MAHGDSSSKFNSIDVIWRLCLAFTLIVVGSCIAFTQPLRPNPYTPPASLWPWQPDPARPGQQHWDFSAWLEPVETNAYWRLPVLSFGDSFSRSLNAIHAAVDGRRLWVVGDKGSIIHSGDGGLTWRPQTSGTENRLHSVQFLDDSQPGWAVGANGTVLTTDNGGHTWLPQTSNTKNTLRSLQFLADGRRGWMVGDCGTILTTADGGQSWQSQPNITQNDLYSVQFLADGQLGWAVGANGTVLVTDNGGHTWRPQSSYTENGLNSVQFLADGQHGWTVGNNGTILNTADGGQSWQAQPRITQNDLYSVQFLADGQLGWAVGANGTVLTTDNGGHTWRPQTSHTKNGLKSVQFLAHSQRGWAVGANLTILTTKDESGYWQSVVTIHRRWPAPWYYLCLLLAAAVLWELSLWQPPTSIMSIRVSDLPLRSADIYPMHFRPIVEALSQLLAYENNHPPFTVAITGDKKSGKSSLMFMFKRRLETENYRCVIYNPSHQQDESQVLQSLLANVQEQLIPSFLTLRGLLLRCRLLWCGNDVGKFCFVLGLAGLLYFAIGPQFAWPSFNLDSPELSWVDYQNWLFEKRGWRGTILLTERDIEKLCKDDNPKDTETPEFSLVDCLTIAQNLTWGTRYSISKEVENPTSTKSPDHNPKAKRQEFPPSADHKREIQKRALSPAGPAISQVNAPGKSAVGLGCRRKYDELKPCEFSSIDALKATVAQVLGHELTSEQQQELTKTSSRMPNKKSEHVQQILTAMAVSFALLLLALIHTEISVLGKTRLLKLFKPFLDKSNIDLASLLEIIQNLLPRERFSSLVRIMAPQQMVIFVDDLDRCRPQHAFKVLEAVHFLSSEQPSCIFVLGFCTEKLKAWLSEKFPEISKEISEEKSISDNGKDAEEQPEREIFVHHYLQKLITVEASLPKLEGQQLRLIFGESVNSELTIWKTLVSNICSMWGRMINALDYLPVGLVAALILAANGLWIYQPTSAQPAKSYKEVLIAPTLASQSKTILASKRKNDIEEIDSNVSNIISPTAPEDEITLLTIPILAGVCVFLGFLLLLRRQPQWFQDKWGFSLILKLLNHFWPSHIERLDSREFEQAFNNWYEVIALKSGTPRSVRAFICRARYLKVLAEAFYSENPNLDPNHSNEIIDAYWLAMTALHYVDPVLLEVIPLYLKKIEVGNVDWKNIAISDDNPKQKAKIQVAVERAINAQQRHGGWPPRQADILLFKWLTEGMKIH